MLTYTHTYIHTHIHTYTHTYIHTYIHTHIHTYITYIHTYIHTHAQANDEESLSDEEQDANTHTTNEAQAAQNINNHARQGAKMVNLNSKGLRMTTVDNYQGEENKIIICSCVRSNPKNISGFLKVQNRVNVMLSRAKMAMYLIGNRETVRRARL
jgi:hypothetical protein